MEHISTIIFISNYFNHHQKNLSEEIYKRIRTGYLFLETEKMSQERKNMGWEMNNYPEYVISSDTLEKDIQFYQNKINEADIVITGSAPETFIKERKRKGKIILRYSERPLKKGNNLMKYFPRLIKWHLNNPIHKSIYMLCASAYTAADYAKFGLFLNRCYKWGYFTECKKYNEPNKLIADKKPASILWVARLIGWKHPDASILVAKRLKEEGYTFHLNIIGSGVMEESLRDSIKENDLSDCVTMLGSMSPEKVRMHMEQSEIFLFTSDRNEGWGAVLNESMNSACAVVVSHAIGSVPFMIKDGTNGLIYEDGNLDSLYEKTKWLLNNPLERLDIARNAYESLVNEWSPEIAASRLFELSEHLLYGKEIDFENGPCSMAEIVRDDWILDAKKV